MAVGDIYRFVAVNFAESQIGLNVTHWRVQAQVGADQTLQDIADELDSLLGALYKPLRSINATHLGGWLNKIFPGPTSVQVTSTTGAGAGTVAGDSMAHQVSGILTFKTALAGRSYRGRAYIPFPGEGDNTADGHPTAGYITRLTALGNGYLTLPNVVSGATNATFEAIVYRRNAQALSERIRDFRPNPKWATQRRRGDYGRTNIVPF